MEAMDHDQEVRLAVPADVKMDDLLRCGVCDLLLCEPVSLPCGHTFCRTCLVKELRRKAKQCPCCGKPCHTRAEDQPQNVMIAQIAKASFPELLERRLRETEAEKAKFGLCLPAFFYNEPVFPGQAMCLHFYESRYKLMMRRIIDTSRRFAYILPGSLRGQNDAPNGKGHIALVAHVCEAEFLSDDRVMVKTKFMGRYTILEDVVEEGTGGLHYCQIEPFEDDAVKEGEDYRELEDLHAQAKALCHGFLGPFKGQLVQAYGEMPSNAVGLSMWMASFLPFYGPEKHALVESRCTRLRLRACLRCVASMEELARASSTRREEKSSAGDPETQSPSPPPPLHTPPQAEAAAEAEAEAQAQGVQERAARDSSAPLDDEEVGGDDGDASPSPSPSSSPSRPPAGNEASASASSGS
ncbi:unnamed protein product [Pylaiella littoralis]